MAVKSMFRSLRHRNFRLFFAGQLISLVGTWMQSIAQAWLIYRLTHSAVLLGVTGFAGQVPVLLLAPIGGVVADRYNRHRLLIATQSSAMLLAFILSALTLSHVVQVWHILVLAACLGVVNAFDVPIRQSFMVHMVGKDDLMNGIALNSSMVNCARIAGPAIAGILVAIVGEGWCFFVNGISYIAVIAGLLMMELPPWSATNQLASARTHIIEGVQYAFKTPAIRAIMILLGVAGLMGMPFSVLMPIFADHILGGGAKALGLLMAMAGVGALLGALLLTLRDAVHGLEKWICFSSLGFGLSLIAFSQSRILWLSALLLLPVGFSMIVQMAASNTVLQVVVPDRLRGRIMAVYSMMVLGMSPFGALMAGALAKPLGAPLTVSLGGLCCMIGAYFFRRQLHVMKAQVEAVTSHSGTAQSAHC